MLFRSVSIVTDLDIRPNDNDGSFDANKENEKRSQITNQVDVAQYPEVSWHIAEHWTLEWCLNESAKFGDLFKQAVSEVHSRTEAFQKDEAGHFDTAKFKEGLTNKLRKYKIGADGKHEEVTQLDKVEVAYHFAQLLETAAIDLTHVEGDTAKYLMDAITHVCS